MTFDRYRGVILLVRLFCRGNLIKHGQYFLITFSVFAVIIFIYLYKKVHNANTKYAQ